MKNNTKALVDIKYQLDWCKNLKKTDCKITKPGVPAAKTPKTNSTGRSSTKQSPNIVIKTWEEPENPAVVPAK